MRKGFNLPHFTLSTRQLHHPRALPFPESIYWGHQPVIFNDLTLVASALYNLAGSTHQTHVSHTRV